MVLSQHINSRSISLDYELKKGRGEVRRIIPFMSRLHAFVEVTSTADYSDQAGVWEIKMG